MVESVSRSDGRAFTADDAWAWNEGTHVSAYDVLGAHRSGSGYSFRVWAPSARAVHVIGDMNARRGEVQGVESEHGACEITAVATLRSLFGYSTDIRSLTQGRGTFTMKFHRYDTSQG